MAEYLSRDTILKIINHTDIIPLFERNLLQEKIKLQPTADVVEVVRCEKCENCKSLTDQFDNVYYFCMLSVNKAKVEADGFGETRSEVMYLCKYATSFNWAEHVSSYWQDHNTITHWMPLPEPPKERGDTI